MTRPAKSAGILTVRSYCKDCSATWEGRNAPYDAIAHHQSTNHHIRVEQTIFWERKCEAKQASRTHFGARQPSSHLAM